MEFFNADGKLTKDEMVGAIKNLGATPTEDDVEEAWKELDTDNSGDVSQSEFVEWYLT